MFRNQRFNVLTFLLLFGLLYSSYIAFIGIASPGGKWYSSFLDRYANVPAWLSYFISASAKGLLKVAGYNVHQKTPNNITIQGSPGVNIIWACLGFGVMSFWAAFVVAHKAAIRYKIKWLLAGFAFITALNIVRIASIALANHYGWNTYTSIEPHFLFNVVSYISIAAFGVLFAYRYDKCVPKKVSKHKKPGVNFKTL